MTTLGQLQEAKKRGLRDKLPEFAQKQYDEAERRGLLHVPNLGSFDTATKEGQNSLMRAMGRDPNVSQAGVPDFGLRAAISAGDTDAEQESRLTEIVGEDGFTRDQFGNLALTPAGLERTGNTGLADKPVRIDEPGPSFGDIADLRGIAPGIAGGVAAGIASGGAGFIPGVLAAGGGAAIGKGFDELIESITGRNQQPISDVVKDVAAEGTSAMVGEGIFRGILAPLGRKMLRPNESATGLLEPKIIPGAKDLAKEAAEIGVRPQISNLQNRKIVNRLSGMVQQIFGDTNAVQNARAFNREVDRLRNLFNSPLKRWGDNVDFAKIGEGIKSDVVAARKGFGDAARSMFALSDEVLPGQKIIPSSQIKRTAKELLDALPREEKLVPVPPGNIEIPGSGSKIGSTGKPFIEESTKAVPGKPVLAGDSLVQELQEIQRLPDFITAENLQAIRNQLFNRLEFGTSTPGVGHREASMLLSSAERALKEGAEQLPALISDGSDQILVKQAVKQLKEAREFYNKGIEKFSNATIARISKDPTKAGEYTPEAIVKALFKRESVTPMKRVMDVVSSERQQQIKAAAMERILRSARKRSSDPLVGFEFDGSSLLKALDDFGPAIEGTFGKEAATSLNRLGRVIQSATRRKGETSGSIVAAAIAVRPLQNIARLAKLRILSKLFSSETGQKWLIQGFDAPKTRTGTAALSRLAVQMKELSDDFNIGVSFQAEEQQ